MTREVSGTCGTRSRTQSREFHGKGDGPYENEIQRSTEGGSGGRSQVSNHGKEHSHS